MQENAPPSDLWAITAYFNPVGFRRRRNNYRLFRQHLGVPLATVELSFDGNFELDPGEADILLQIAGGDVMWQKERLLNMAVKALPKSCTKVVWLDCDLIFDSPDWSRLTSERLDELPLVQPFSHVYRTPMDWQFGDRSSAGTDLLRSIPFLIENGKTIRECMEGRAEQIGAATGMGWSARRSVVETYGLYDAGIIGGGDAALVRAAFGYLDALVEKQRMAGPAAIHYRAWAEAFHGTIAGKVGHVPGSVYHLWHGDLRHRDYLARFEMLFRCGFDPFHDIALTEAGAWRWNSQKPRLHATVRDYFYSRLEDG